MAWPSGLVTTTLAGPTAPPGVRHTIRVAEVTVTLVAAAPPKVTDVAPVVWNAVPVNVTSVLPR